MLNILQQRRSTRKFSDKPVDSETVALFKEAVLRSASSKNNKPWEFIFVNDSDLLQKLSKSKPTGASFLQHAPFAIVVAADPEKSDVWVEDCSIASITIQYLAQSLNLGSCWVQIRKRDHKSGLSASDYIKNILQIPSRYEILSVIAVGHMIKEKKGITLDELDFNKIHINKF
jgi:nitroreductase